MLITTTLAIVLFTIVVFGGGTFPLLKLLERWKDRSARNAAHRSGSDEDGSPAHARKTMSLSGALDRAVRAARGACASGRIACRLVV